MKFSFEITVTNIFVLVGRIQIGILLFSCLSLGVQTLGVQTFGVPQWGLVALAVSSITIPVFATEKVIKCFYILQGIATLAFLGWLAM